MNENDARSFLLELPDGEVYPLLEVAEALNREGPPLVPGDIPVSLMIELLQLHEVDTWARTGRPNAAHGRPLVPFAHVPRDGQMYRSFDPNDVKPEDESKLRDFALHSNNPFVRARIFDTLFMRFGRFPDSKESYEARFAMAERLLDGESWTATVSNAGHLMTLLSTRAKDQLPRVVGVLDKIATKLKSSDRPFAFPVLADVVVNTMLGKKNGRDTFTKQRADEWAIDMEAIATKYRADGHHGHDALVILQSWYSRWGEQDKQVASRRRVVEQQLEIADAKPQISSWIVQRALQSALDYGISDLVERCRLKLMAAIKASVANFKAISGRFQVPQEALDQIDFVIASSQTPSMAIRQLAVLPGLLEIDREQISSATKDFLSDNPLSLFVTSANYHREGKVTFQASDPEGNTRRQTATSIGFHLVMIEAMLRHVLDRLFPSFAPTTLLDALGEWPHLADSRSALLGVAAERFANQDWVSSGYLVATLYESVLRDLLRAAGYSALKIEAGGTQMDETLNSLLRSNPVRQLLGVKHCDLVEFVLCEPAFGWNMRNEIAHGTIRPDSLSPTRVFMVWLLVIRLTSYVAQPSAGTDSTNTTPDACAVEPQS